MRKEEERNNISSYNGERKRENSSEVSTISEVTATLTTTLTLNLSLSLNSSLNLLMPNTPTSS